MARMKIHTIMFLSTGIIICIALGIGTILNSSDLRHSSLEAFEWRAQALAERFIDAAAGIFQTAGHITPELSRELSLLCQQIYDANPEKQVTHIAVLLADGRIAAHNDSHMIDTMVESKTLQTQLAAQSQTTVLDNAVYHTLVPIFTTNGQNYVGSVDIGFPKQAIDAKSAKLWVRFIVLVAIFLGVTFAIVSVFMQTMIIKPIKHLTVLSERLADGNVEQHWEISAQRDEIFRLGSVLSRVAEYIQHLARDTSQIANGILSGGVSIRSQRDVMGLALQDMLRYLNDVAEMATRLSTGNLRGTIRIRSEDDGFGKSLQAMTNGLRDLILAVHHSVDAMAETGMTISNLTEHNIHLAQQVHTVTENMMSTMQDMGVSVEEVAHSMNTLSESVQETSDSVLMITASITHIAGNASDLTTGSHQTIEAMEGAMESLENIVRSTDISEQLSQETIRDALAGQEAFEHVMSSMEQIEETIATSVNVITQFERRSQDIDTILDVIREITEQTGLLALNASIIAAQAGEHGKSFGVVAQEIKELAQGVGASTKDIASILSTLQKDTRMVVKTIHRGADSVREGTNRMQDAQQTLGKIIHSARRSSNVVSEIAEALRKVMATSRQVVTAMEEVKEMTDDFTMATNEQEMSTEQINNAVTLINTMASQIRRVTDKQLTGVHQMLDAANDVTALLNQNLESSRQLADITELLASQAAQLVRSVDRFKFDAEFYGVLPDSDHEGDNDV